MAGEGLFFTGEVLKNNRKLLDEEIARQQLNIQKEQLEIQKQAAANKRKDARKKNEVKPNDYSLEDMNPFYAEYFQGRVSEYQGFVTNNSLGFEDNLDLKSKKLKDEGDLSLLANDLKSRSSDLSGYKQLIKSNKGDQLALAEDGSYLFEYNLNKQIEALQSGDMTFDEALKAYPTDVDSVMKRTEWIDPTIALFAADNDSRKGLFDDEDDGYTYKIISDSQKNVTQTTIKNSLTVNSQGFHNDPNYKRLYDTKLLTIGGNEITAKEAFFLEAYFDKDTEQTGGITDATNLLDILDPESERFDKPTSNAYAEYLAKKISEEGYKDMTRERSGKITGETSAEKKSREAEEAQMEYNVNTSKIISSSKPGDEANTGYLTYYGHPNLAKDLTKGIKSDSPLSAILNPSSDQAIAFKEVAQASMKDATTMEFDVISITLDSNGLPVALIQIPNNPNSKAFIPYSRLSSRTIEMLGDDVKNIVNYKKPTPVKKSTPISR